MPSMHVRDQCKKYGVHLHDNVNQMMTKTDELVDEEYMVVWEERDRVEQEGSDAAPASKRTRK